MAISTAKWVVVRAQGGVVANFQGQAGTSNALVLPFVIIKRLIDRGALVYELVEDADPIQLTADNYNTSNGGIEVPDEATVVADIEGEAEEMVAAIRQAEMDEKSNYYKELFASLTTSSTSTSDSGTSSDTTSSSSGSGTSPVGDGEASEDT